jgi:hypothetical protein
MLDPALSSLGRAFFGAGGGWRVATGGEGEDDEEGGDGAKPRAGRGRSALLQLLVARHGAKAVQALDLTAAGALLLRRVFRACGRRLLSPAAACQVKLEERVSYAPALASAGPCRRRATPPWACGSTASAELTRLGKRASRAAT